jgi:alpha-galactosidase
MSREQHVPIINALVNNVRGDFQINIPNRGYLKDIPNNVVVEVPATIDKDGIHVGEIIQLPPKIVLTVLMPRMIKMECEFYAFKTGDKGMLLAMMLDDPRTKTVEQAEELLEDLFSYEFNCEIAKYFGYIQ